VLLLPLLLLLSAVNVLLWLLLAAATAAAALEWSPMAGLVDAELLVLVPSSAVRLKKLCCSA